MEWMTVSPNVEGALEELKMAGDRAAAIVAAALVEEHLADALCLHRKKRKIEKSTFSKKINLGLEVDLFTAKAHCELITIKDVRNLFAHELRVRSFDTPKVNDLVTNLVKHEQAFTIEWGGGKGKLTLAFAYKPPDPHPPAGARERYIRSCRFYTAVFSAVLTRASSDYPTMLQPFV
jgi:hypothetical protein